MYFLSGRIKEKPSIVAVSEIQRVGKGSRRVHFGVIPLCTFGFLNHTYVLFLFQKLGEKMMTFVGSAELFGNLEK